MIRAALRYLVPFLAGLSALAAAAAYADVEVGIDTSTEGNSQTELGDRDSCVPISVGDTGIFVLIANEVR